MREKTIEESLVSEVKKRDGLAFKFNSLGCNGVPDRIVLLPGHAVIFVELKAPSKEMRPLPKKRKRDIEALGFKVICLDDRSKIGEILDGIQTV